MKKKTLSLLMVLVFACAMLFVPTLTSGAGLESAQNVEFHFLNVNSIEKDTGGPIGSADTILIIDNGVITLVDTGTEQKTSTSKVINYLKDLGISKIDHLFLTHPHNDHVGGAPDVVEAFDIVNAYYTTPADWTRLRPSEYNWDTKLMSDLMSLSLDEKVNSDGSTVNVIHPDQEGKVYTINKDSYFTVYNCLAVVKNNYREPEFNDFSMMMKYTHKNVNALLTGDINIQYEYTMTGLVTTYGTKCSADDPNAIDPVGPCQIFKLPHHGTQGSLSTEAFFAHINPNKDTSYLAVVTGYRSNIGKDTQPRCEKYGYQYKVTHDGDVVVKTDGTTQWFA